MKIFLGFLLLFNGLIGFSMMLSILPYLLTENYVEAACIAIISRYYFYIAGKIEDLIDETEKEVFK